ncbi:Rha family transcriptional regulator [Aeromonas molluscorum]|uniref:Phage regulatory protein, Rha-like protein n=1 Tax=Aeromonas molluscorum 848 TaxID=1268236 RepID=R1F2R8_9GAMM|nr:Rha family transcriptional regulator [Aeromonas molluscorum]EOD54142.1 Phage regulatory protein, Rha-like protein [Aeromonas molluscorum 848]
MNLTTTTNTSLTMTNIEIAELVGKRHDNVMRDIRAMLLELHGAGGDLRFEETHQNKQNEKPYEINGGTRLAFSLTITGKGQQWLTHKLLAAGHLQAHAA